jgi:hypothetical protein
LGPAHKAAAHKAAHKAAFSTSLACDLCQFEYASSTVLPAFPCFELTRIIGFCLMHLPPLRMEHNPKPAGTCNEAHLSIGAFFVAPPAS